MIVMVPYGIILDASEPRWFSDWRTHGTDLCDVLRLLSSQFQQVNAEEVRIIAGPCPAEVLAWMRALPGSHMIETGAAVGRTWRRALTGTNGLVVLLTGGNLWVEPLLNELVEEHADSGAGITLFDFHAGFSPIVADATVLSAIPAAVRLLEPYLRQRADHPDTGVRQVRRSIPNQNSYLRTDLPEGWRALASIARSGRPRGKWGLDRDLRERIVLTRENYRRSFRAISVFRHLEGARVLEIGCAPDKEDGPRVLLEEFGVEHYTGVNFDPIEFPSGWRDERATFHMGDVRAAPLRAGEFDLIFSIAVLEHVENPRDLFNRIPGWLRTGGGHYGKFQTWSSAHGYHLPPGGFKGGRLPPYAHLTMKPDELRDYLRTRMSDESLIDDAVRRVYADPYINRVSTAEFVDMIRGCGLEVVYLDGRGNGRIRPESVRAAEALGGRHTVGELACQGLEFYLRKSDFRLLDMPAAGG